MPSGDTTAHPHARASQAVELSPPARLTATAARPSSSARSATLLVLTVCTRPRASTGTYGRSGRRPRRSRSERQPHLGPRGGEADEGTDDAARLGAPLAHHELGLPLRAGHEAGVDCGRDHAVLAGVDLGCALGRRLAGRDQGVDATAQPLPLAASQRVVDRPLELGVERRHRQAAAVLERGRGDTGQQRLVDVDDVEAARAADRQRDVCRRGHGEARAAVPAAAAVGHRGADGDRQRLAGQRRSSRRGCPRPARAAAGARCAAPPKTRWARAPSLGARAQQAHGIRRVRARRPGGRPPARTGRRGKCRARRPPTQSPTA